jgi:O-antigen ligase
METTMSAADEFQASQMPLRRAVPVNWLATGVAALAVASLLAPRGLHTIVPLLLILLVAARSLQAFSFPARSGLTLRPANAIGPIECAIACFLILRAATSPEPLHALTTLVIATVYIAMMFAIMRLVSHMNGHELHLVRRSIVFAVCVGAAFILSELLSSLSLMTAALSGAPVLAGGNRIHFVTNGDVIEAVRPYVLDRNVAVLNLLLWPALLIAARDARFWSLKASYAAVPVICMLAAAATFLSRHESSKVALVCAALIFALSRYSPKLGRAVVVAAWMIATLAVVPIVELAHKQGLHNSEFIPGSARARVILWNYEAKQIPSNFFFGKGIDSVRYYDELQGPAAQRLPGEMAPQRNGRHSHNVYLQVWYEFGLAGAVLFMIAGLLVLRRVSRIDDADFPYINAAVVTAMTIAAFSWGMWQTWYLAALCITAVMAAVALAKRSSGRLFDSRRFHGELRRVEV